MKYFHQVIAIISDLRNFMLFWFGQSLSEIGNRLTGFGLSIWVYQHTHAVTQLSLVLFFTALPGVLITPFVGALVDRWPRKLTIICSEIAASLVIVALVMLLLTGNLELWHTYISAFLTSVCGSFQMTAKAAALPVIVPLQQMGRANGLVQLSSAVGQLAAPVLAGILIASLELKGLLLIDLCTYLITLGTLVFVHIPEPVPKVASTQGLKAIFDDVRSGWEHISANLVLMILLIFMTISFFMNGMTSVLINPLILSFASTTIFGSIMSIAGGAMVIGSMIMSIWGGGEKNVLNLFVFSALNGIGLVIAGVSPSVSTIALGISLSFFTLPLILSINSTIWQTSIPVHMQGRVLSLFYTLIGLGAAIGTLSASPLTDGLLEPMLAVDGLLAHTVGQFIQTGEGRGIGFLMIIEGLIMFVISTGLYSYFKLTGLDYNLSLARSLASKES